jgi:hypothetical protein
VTSPFDGAGKPFRGPSYRVAVTMALVIMLVLAGLWLATSWTLNEADKRGINTQVDGQQLTNP